MPIIIDTRNEDPSITRNVVNSIIKNLTKWLSLPKDLRIEYWGDIGSAHQTGSGVDDVQNDIKLTSDGKITVDVDEDYDEDSLINQVTKQKEEPPYWVDPALEFMLRPIRTQSVIQLSFTYRAPTKTAANRFRNNIKMLAASGRETHVHELAYHVPVPLEFVVLAGDIHAKRETVAPYGEKFGTYLKNHTKATLTTISVDGRRPTLVVAERQLPVLGWFEDIVTQKPSKDDESPTYNVTFDYKVQYQRIIGFVIDHPIMVHNQLLDSRLWSSEPQYSLEQRLFKPGMMQDHTVNLQRLYNPIKPNIAGVRIPEYDPWLPRVLPSYTVSMFTIMLGLPTVTTTPQRLMSFGDIQDYTINPLVYKFMLDEAPWMGKRYRSFFQIDIYRGDQLIEPGGISCTVEDNQLVVYYTGELDLRKTYHIRLSTVMSWDALDDRAKDAMKEHGRATWEFLVAGTDEGGTSWGVRPDDPDFVYGTYLPGDIIQKELGKWQPDHYDLSGGIDIRLIEFLSIISRNRGQ